MKIQLKNLPKLSLLKLLQRRKMSLVQFLDENKVKTYDELLKKCSSGQNCLNVVAPTQKEFDEALPQTIALSSKIIEIVHVIPQKLENLVTDVSITPPVELNVGHSHNTESPRESEPETKEENDSKKHSKKKIKTDE